MFSCCGQILEGVDPRWCAYMGASSFISVRCPTVRKDKGIASLGGVGGRLAAGTRGPWQLLCHDELRRRAKGNRIMRAGVLELFAQDMTFTSPDHPSVSGEGPYFVAQSLRNS